MRISDWSSDVCSSDLYHLYYKAPDWIGPKVARALRIPYVVAEASVAYKRASGPWAASHRAVLEALGQAAAVISLNPLDAKLIPDPSTLRPLKPFIDTAPYDAVRPLRDDYRAVLASEQQLDPDLPWLLAAAMMRPGAKLKSYQILAQALRAIDRQSVGTGKSVSGQVDIGGRR